MITLNFFKSTLLILLVSFFGYSQKKFIQTQEYEEVFYTTNDKIVPDVNTDYFWYKSNTIFKTRGDFGGELILGSYSKYSVNNELIEKGDFEFGVKVGVWKSWFTNGSVSFP